MENLVERLVRSSATHMTRTGPVAALGLAALVGAVFADPVAAHVGGMNDAIQDPGIPLWLTATTGGAVVGVSFLFASFVTDHDLIRVINGARIGVPSVPTVGTVLHRGGRVFGVLVLVAILASALTVPGGLQRPGLQTFPLLVVWAGWWAGYTMTVYLFGNTWPTLNPWRAIVEWGSAGSERLLGREAGTRTYPERLGVWPSVVGLLGMVWLEVVSPVASDPQLLASVVIGYTFVTVLGGMVYGAEAWFGYVDPVSRVFRWYGRMAPLQRTEDGIGLTLPNGALSKLEADRFDEVPFVVAILWVTTYDGLVGTPVWEGAIAPVFGSTEAVVSSVLPAGAARTVTAFGIYSVGIVVGYAIFLGAYKLASRRAPTAANSFVTGGALERSFLPALLPIAAGYHLAHFLPYFLSLSLPLSNVVWQPFTPLEWGLNGITVFGIPSWMSLLQLGLVVFGHVLAVWVAHGIAFEVFPGRLKPIRSQYPYTLVMVFYTTVSMAIVAQPFGPPPFL
jgi:hypothetical protein